MIKMMANQIYQSSSHSVELKIEELKRSVSNVYKYELLTTNQYLQQMELVLEIFNDITDLLAHQ